MKNIKIILSKSENIYENLAFEEFLLLNSVQNILLFYINKNAVVIGKHQNPWKEVNLSIDENLNTHTVARRLSGGGTVYHDLGNLNFSFIRNKEDDFVNFREHIEPISGALASLGIPNTISPRNDIFVNEHKVSGNAEHVNSKVKRILHHGTLLYDSDIIKLNGSIRPKKIMDIKTHAVDSVRSPVMNMREIKDCGDTTIFLKKLTETICFDLDISDVKTVEPSEIDDVTKLVTNKYRTWDWIFGHTPQFTYTDEAGLSYKIRKGFVMECLDTNLIGNRFDTIINDQ